MIHSLSQHKRVAELWRETELHLLQSASEDREAVRESYIRKAVRVLQRPEFGGYVATDLSDLTRHADRVEALYIRRAFKRLHKRGEIEKVAPVGDGMVYRLV